MTPLEFMAKTAWEAENKTTPWDHVSDLSQGKLKGYMRLAMLALAEIDLPEEHSAAAYAPLSTRDQAHIDSDALMVAFKAMCRSIAETPHG